MSPLFDSPYWLLEPLQQDTHWLSFEGNCSSVFSDMIHLSPDDSHLIGPRPTASPALLKMIGEQFTIGTIMTSRDVGGTYNLNLHITTATNVQYVARIYRPWTTAERLQTLFEVKNCLRQIGIPAPLPVQSLTSDPYIVYNDALIELESYVHHNGICDTYARYRTGLTVLAQIHDQLEQSLSPDDFVPPRVANYGEPEMLMGWVQHVEKRVTRQNVMSLCHTTRSLLTNIADWWQSTGHALPVRFAHGDYGGENLLFDDDRLVAVLDLDFLARRERIFDIAYMLYWMFVRLEGYDLANLDQLAAQSAIMLKRYNASAESPLTAGERAALPYELARIPLYWVGAAVFVDHPAEEILRQAAGVGFAKQILQHRHLFSEQMERHLL